MKTSPGTASDSGTRRMAENLLLAVLYFCTARLGQLLAIPPGNITPVWPPSGIALAAILIYGYRVWPGIALGVFAWNIWAYFSTASVGALLQWLLAGTASCTGSTLGAMIGAYLIQRTTDRRNPLHRAADMAKLIGYGAVLGTAISALFGATSLALAGILPWAHYRGALATWWIGDGTGVLFLTPLLLAWRGGWRGCRLGREELAALICLAGFSLWGAPQSELALALAALPFLLWGVCRFDPRVAFSMIAAAATMTILVHVFGQSPFWSDNPTTNFIYLQLLLAALTAPLFILHSALSESRTPGGHGFRVAPIFLPVSILLAVVLSAVGYLSCQNYAKNDLAGVNRELSSIAELKVAELLQWRKERLGDGAIFSRNTVFYALVQRVLETPDDAEARSQLQVWLTKFQATAMYDQIRLFDAHGVLRLAVPANPTPPAPALEKGVSEVLRTRKMLLQDFSRCEDDHKIYTTTLVPICNESGADRPVAVLALRSNASQNLYPLICRWPTCSRTAEILLVRRDGQDAQYLNDLRYQTNAALTLRVPLSQTAVPAVRAVLGQTGSISGVDYRGVSVLAQARKIPDSSWRLLVKIDAAEAYAPMHQQLWQMGGMLVLLLFGLGLGALLLFYHDRLQQMAALQASETKYQMALAENEERFRLSMEATSDGLWDWDIPSDASYFSPGYYRMLGYEPGEFAMQGQAWQAMIHPADRDAVLRANHDCIDGRCEQFQVEYRLQTKTGEWRWILGRSKCVRRDAQGRGLRLVGTHMDITERKLAAEYRAMGLDILHSFFETEDLRASCQRVVELVKMRAGLDAVGLRLRNGEDFPFYVQHGYPDDFLVTENTLVEHDAGGGTCREPDGHVSLDCACGQVIYGKTDPAKPCFTPGGSFWTNDTSLWLNLPALQSDPRLRPRSACLRQGYASLALVPIRNEAQVVGLLHLACRRKGCFTREVVEVLENIALHIGSGLLLKETRVEKSHLSKQLVQAQKMEAVGRLAGGVAHDFNNMLTAILGFSDMCWSAMTPENPIRGWLAEIIKAAERSANLTRQLLAFSRQQIIAPKEMDLNDAVASMLKLLRRLIGEEIAITWQPGAALWTVKLDAAQLDQILANLAINARDAINGTGAIQIATANVVLDAAYCADHLGAVPGNYVQLTFRDNGCGMDSETKAHIFEPFFTTKEVGKGTGLGLATVYGIVKQNGGYITVQSEPGQGARFEIYLPQCVAPRSVAPTAEPRTEPPRGGETILLVEDEDVVRNVAYYHLKNLGYNVLVAENPEKALLLVAQHAGEIHLLITDVIMPGMNGRILAQRLAELRPSMKCIHISGFPAEILAKRGIMAEAVNFLAKPFTCEQLARKVREVLNGRK